MLYTSTSLIFFLFQFAHINNGTRGCLSPSPPSIVMHTLNCILYTHNYYSVSTPQFHQLLSLYITRQYGTIDNIYTSQKIWHTWLQYIYTTVSEKQRPLLRCRLLTHKKGVVCNTCVCVCTEQERGWLRCKNDKVHVWTVLNSGLKVGGVWGQRSLMISTIYNFNEFEGKMSSSVVYFSFPHSVLVLPCDFYHVPSLQERERGREGEKRERSEESGEWDRGRGVYIGRRDGSEKWGRILDDG